MQKRWFIFLALVLTAAQAWGADVPPKQWIDPDTGHLVIRLSDEPNSLSLYFHQNAYTPDGRKLVFTSPTGIYMVDLFSHKIEQILAAPTGQSTGTPTGARITVIIVGRKKGLVYYMQTDGPDNRSVWAIDPYTKQKTMIAKLPAGVGISTVNCDETMMAGTLTEVPKGVQPVRAQRGQRINLAERWAQHLPMELVTLNIKTGKFNYFNHSTDWLNHVQFSPTDPNQLLFCHEGPWQNNQRIWTIRTDGSKLTMIHRRTMINEIFGHEFWSHDGNIVWFDLQTPRSEVFWVGGVNIKTGEQYQYHLTRDEWSVHYNVSPDGTLFAGDGGGPNNVAHAANGQWIYLFRPVMERNMAAGVYSAKDLIHAGRFDAEKLVNLSKHNYTLEPNVNFTPDGKWIVFRSNMFGPSYVFEVQVAKAG
jgi:oligogalacturonide lyase